jgi:2,4-dienoyl-CoA reductase (NADPH2)
MIITGGIPPNLEAMGGGAKLSTREEAAEHRLVTEAVHAADGQETYAALRTLWRQWDQTDPAVVEASLADVADDARRAPPVRA